MMAAGLRHIKVIDDRKWPLAFLLQQPGDTCLYTYDLGDYFEHILLLEEVYTGACIHLYSIIYVSTFVSYISYIHYTYKGDELSREVELIEGKGACPPENSTGLDGAGSDSWANILHEYKANPNSREMKESIKEIETASNYRSDWLTGRPVPCRPLEYDIERHRLLLAAMLAGIERMYIMPLLSYILWYKLYTSVFSYVH